MNNDGGQDLFLDLDGAIIRYLAAQHASLVESYDNPEGFDSTTDLVFSCIVELRDAADAILTDLPR
jgi:hypothetical protein